MQLRIFFLATLFFVANNCRHVETAVKGEAGDQATTCRDRLEAFMQSEQSSDDQIQEVFSACLKAYIQIKTTNDGNEPTGEKEAVSFLESLLQVIGVEVRTYESPDLTDSAGLRRNMNIIGTLRPANADATNRAVVLLHHMDTVDAVASQWTIGFGPYSGRIGRAWQESKDHLFGRGALDMKNIGIMHLLAIAMLKKEGAALRQTVHFVGVADEEHAASGSKELLKKIARGELPDMQNISVILNEGGFGIENPIGSNTSLHLIGTAERGGAWIKLRAKNPQALQEDLGRLQLIPYQKSHILRARDPFWRRWESWGCRLLKVGPGVSEGRVNDFKVNVIPSLVSIEMRCLNEPSKEDILWAFNWDEFADILRLVLGGPVTIEGVAINSTFKHGDLKIEIATSSSGHGSMSSIVSAIDIAAYGLQKIGALQPPAGNRKPDFFNYQYPAASQGTIDALGRISQKALGVSPTRFPSFFELIRSTPDFLVDAIMHHGGGYVGIEKLFRSSCSWTGWTVDADDAQALLDCRLINTRKQNVGLFSHAQEFQSQVWRLINGERTHPAYTKVELIEGWNYTESTQDNEQYKAIVSSLKEYWPDSEVASFMIPGGTDSTYFRDPRNAGLGLSSEGIPAYGLTPAQVAPSVIEGFHGSDERFPVDQMTPSVKAYKTIIYKLANLP